MTIREENEMKKSYLNKYRFVCNRIKTLERQIEELRETQEQAKVQELNAVPGGSHNQTDLSDYIVRLEKLEERVSREKEEKRKEKLEIEATILDIDNDAESDVLYHRYVLLEEWETIAKKMNLSRRSIFRLHGRALVNMQLKNIEKK